MQNVGSKHLLVFFLLLLSVTARAASTLYLGTDRGPYRSTDSGATWKQVFATITDPKLQGLPKIVAMVVDPQNPSKVYASANFGSPHAILKSTDAGQTWSTTSQPNLHFQPSLVIDPVQANVLYSTSNTLTPPPPDQNADPILRSMDSGTTWAPLKLFNPSGRCGSTNRGPRISSLATDPNATGVLYAIGPGQGTCGESGGGFIFKSVDYGDTWSLLTDGQEFGGRLYVDPRNSQVLYATGNAASFPQCRSTNGGLCGAYKSSDGGKAWTELALPSAAVRSFTLDATSGVLYAVVPFNVINYHVWKSADAGNTWTLLNPGTLFASGATPSGNIAADPGAPLTVYLTSFESINRLVLKSTDGGATWATIRIPQACDPPNAAICSWPPDFSALVVAPPAPTPLPVPAISANGVVGTASSQVGVVANSWVSIYGTNLSPGTLSWGNAIVDGKLPVSLGGVSVTIGGKPAYVNFVSSGQINVLAPDVPPGPVSVTVTTGGGTSTVLTTTASQYGPAFFLWPGNQPVATRQDFTFAAKAGTFPGATTVPARPGDVIILWGTGFGPTTPAAPVGLLVPSDQLYATGTLPAVTINNTSVTVYGAALAPGFAGLYQVAIQVPDTLADGDWPVQTSIGGVLSPAGILLSVRR